MSALTAAPNQPASQPNPSRKPKLFSFRHILLATDFSPASERALGYAITLARHYGSELSIVHSIAPERRDPIPLEPLPRELNRAWLEAERHMQDLVEAAPLRDLNHHSLLEQGPVWGVLASVIQREKIGLLVLGTRGRGGLKKLALGSVAEEVLRLAPCAAHSFRLRFRTRGRESLPLCPFAGGRLSIPACASAPGAAYARTRSQPRCLWSF